MQTDETMQRLCLRELLTGEVVNNRDSCEYGDRHQSHSRNFIQISNLTKVHVFIFFVI